MQTIRQALSILADQLNLKGIELNTDQHAELILPSGESLYLTAVGEFELEFSYALKGLGLQTPGMNAALIATDPTELNPSLIGRFGVDTNTRGQTRAQYCQRLDVKHLGQTLLCKTFAQLVDAFSAFNDLNQRLTGFAQTLSQQARPSNRNAALEGKDFNQNLDAEVGNAQKVFEQRFLEQFVIRG